MFTTAPRVQLHNLLKEILGSENVYFQAPPNNMMVYPCIIYKRDDVSALHANNETYRYTQRYQVTYIDRKPDSLIPGKIGRLPLCVYDRFYVADNLNHDVFNLYY